MPYQETAPAAAIEGIIRKRKTTNNGLPHDDVDGWQPLGGLRLGEAVRCMITPQHRPRGIVARHHLASDAATSAGPAVTQLCRLAEAAPESPL